MKYRNVNQAEYLYNSTFNMGKGVEGHCQVVERGGGFILGRRAMGGGRQTTVGI